MPILPASGRCMQEARCQSAQAAQVGGCGPSVRPHSPAAQAATPPQQARSPADPPACSTLLTNLAPVLCHLFKRRRILHLPPLIHVLGVASYRVPAGTGKAPQKTPQAAGGGDATAPQRRA